MKSKSLLTPDLIVRHVGDVSSAQFAEQKVRAVVTDLDNTLVEWRREHVAEEVAVWLLELKAKGIKVCIASNTRHLSRLDRLAEQMGILRVPGNAGKPGTNGLRRALHLMEVTAGETAMVGDQLFTDVLAGNRLGMYTVLVNPLTRHEFIGTRVISRNLERLVLRGHRSRPR